MQFTKVESAFRRLFGVWARETFDSTKGSFDNGGSMRKR